MIDRSYLPYESARTFQDRGMAKWTGFFLSEHTSVLKKKELDREKLRRLGREEITQQLSQSYILQLPILITYLEKNQLLSKLGTVSQLSFHKAIVKSSGRYTAIDTDTILSVSPQGDDEENDLSL